MGYQFGGVGIVTSVTPDMRGTTEVSGLLVSRVHPKVIFLWKALYKLHKEVKLGDSLYINVINADILKETLYGNIVGVCSSVNVFYKYRDYDMNFESAIVIKINHDERLIDVIFYEEKTQAVRLGKVEFSKLSTDTLNTLMEGSQLLMDKHENKIIYGPKFWTLDQIKEIQGKMYDQSKSDNHC